MFYTRCYVALFVMKDEKTIKEIFDNYIYEATLKDESMLKVVSDIIKNKKISDAEKCTEIKNKIDFYWKKREQLYNDHLRRMRKKWY